MGSNEDSNQFQSESHNNNNIIYSFELLPKTQGLQNLVNIKDSRFEKEENQEPNPQNLTPKIEKIENKLDENPPDSLQKSNSLDEKEKALSTQIQLLQQELEAYKSQIIQLHNQIEAHELQKRKLSQEKWQLEQESCQKCQIITQLNSKIADLERLATIGDRQLNKWRSRTFSS